MPEPFHFAADQEFAFQAREGAEFLPAGTTMDRPGQFFFLLFGKFDRKNRIIPVFQDFSGRRSALNFLAPECAGDLMIWDLKAAMMFRTDLNLFRDELRTGQGLAYNMLKFQ